MRGRLGGFLSVLVTVVLIVVLISFAIYIWLRHL
jgi:hypothetical protein